LDPKGRNLVPYIFCFDPQLRCTFVSNAALSVLGISNQSLLGKTLHQEDFPMIATQKWEQALQNALAKGTDAEVDITPLEPKGNVSIKARITPIRAEENIINELWTYIEIHREFEHNAHHSEPMNGAILELWNATSIMERLNNKPELVIRIMVAFLKDTPNQIAKLNHSLQQGYWSELTKQIHNLKGAAISVGGRGMYEKIKALEATLPTQNISTLSNIIESITQEFEQLNQAVELWISQNQGSQHARTHCR
jgi:HPt (histidine-containing phosphotransfer) domain-containing protein